MRRNKYRIFLIIVAIIITLVGIWCIVDLRAADQVVKGTFVYAK